APDAGAGVVDQDVDLAELVSDGGEGGRDRCGVAHVAGEALGVGELFGEGARGRFAARHEGYGIAAAGESPREGGAVSRTNADDGTDSLRGSLVGVLFDGHAGALSRRRANVCEAFDDTMDEAVRPRLLGVHPEVALRISDDLLVLLGGGASEDAIEAL